MYSTIKMDRMGASVVLEKKVIAALPEADRCREAPALHLLLPCSKR